MHFESAAALAVEFAAHLDLAPTHTVLNLNVPNLALGEIRGIRRASLATSGLILAAEAVDGGPRVRFDLGVSKLGDEDESDENLTQLGWAVISSFSPASSKTGATRLVTWWRLRWDLRGQLLEKVRTALGMTMGIARSHGQRRDRQHGQLRADHPAWHSLHDTWMPTGEILQLIDGL